MPVEKLSTTGDRGRHLTDLGRCWQVTLNQVQWEIDKIECGPSCLLLGVGGMDTPGHRGHESQAAEVSQQRAVFEQTKQSHAGEVYWTVGTSSTASACTKPPAASVLRTTTQGSSAASRKRPTEP